MANESNEQVIKIGVEFDSKNAAKEIDRFTTSITKKFDTLSQRQQEYFYEHSDRLTEKSNKGFKVRNAYKRWMSPNQGDSSRWTQIRAQDLFAPRGSSSLINEKTSMFAKLSDEEFNAKYGDSSVTGKAKALFDSKMKDATNGLMKYSKKLDSIKKNKAFIKITRDLKQTSKSLAIGYKFINKLKGIALYRAVRATLAAISQGTREGINNLYEWSRLNDGRFKKSMDALATSFLHIKNAVAAVSLAPVIENVLVPLIKKVENIFIMASNQISMFAARLKGESKYPLKKMLGLAFDGITSFSTKPISFIVGLGVVVLVISFLAAIYAFASYISGYVEEGWTSLILSIWFLGGVQLISIGIIGEYIGKIYMEYCEGDDLINLINQNRINIRNNRNKLF